MKADEYGKINVLFNIDHYRGDHKGRLGPMLLCVIICVAPFVLYTFLLSTFVPLWVIIVFEVVWSTRVSLYILGNEQQKLAIYLGRQKAAREDERFGIYSRELNKSYDSISRIVKLTNCTEDGLCEYMNGNVAYMLVGYINTYADNDVFSVDMEDFLADLGRDFTYDIYMHNVYGENMLQNDLSALTNYTDNDFVVERRKMLCLQDDVANKKTLLYRYVFLVKARRPDWKLLREHVNNIVNVYNAKLFNSLKVANRQEVSDILSRDITSYVDLQQMLEDKYIVENYNGAKVLFYGDSIPDEYKDKAYSVSLNKRRVSKKENSK